MLTLIVREYSDINTFRQTTTFPPVQAMSEIHGQAARYRNMFFHTLRIEENGVSRQYHKNSQ